MSFAAAQEADVTLDGLFTAGGHFTMRTLGDICSIHIADSPLHGQTMISFILEFVVRILIAGTGNRLFNKAAGIMAWAWASRSWKSKGNCDYSA